MSKFILEVIQAAISIGLNVRSICSDMGNNNKALWASLGICVSRDQRKTNFKENSSNRQVHVLADAPIFLKIGNLPLNDLKYIYQEKLFERTIYQRMWSMEDILLIFEIMK